MAPPPTILALKQSFLSKQTRLLSVPLEPSRAWRSANERAGDDDRLTERAIEDALIRANQALIQHERRVHPPQATRHVAEQIDNLYWNAGERAVVMAAEEDEEREKRWQAQGLSLGVGAVDFGDIYPCSLPDPDTIASLPATWASERDAARNPMEAKRYAELVENLRSLAEEKTAALESVTRLRRMREMLAPFAVNDDVEEGEGSGGNGVQENLVTRNGEVEREMERMRSLLARVSSRVRQLPAGGGDEEMDVTMAVDDVEEVERKKVDDLLAGFGGP